MRQPRLSGFTLIELLVVITIIGILAAIALPNYIRAKDKARETQVKSNLHALQTAIERYSTDMGEYPLFLIGGDIEGWTVWHDRFDEGIAPAIGPANRWLNDPLLAGGYLETYPANPFVDDGLAVIGMTGPLNLPPNGVQAGDGDPRFGFRGTTMGNGVEYPALFRNWHFNPHLRIETERTLTTSSGGDPFAKGFGIPDSDPRGLHYAMGGRKERVQGELTGTQKNFWPGNFFYRGLPEIWLEAKGWSIPYPTEFLGTDVNRYMLGGYGAFSTDGIDALRLITKGNVQEQIFYRLPPPWADGNTAMRCNYEVEIRSPVFGGSGGDWKGGLPEMCGGGDSENGPFWPYDRDPKYPGQFIYGSPDGHPDGVVMVLTPGEEIRSWE